MNYHPDMTIAVDWDVKHQTKPKTLQVHTFVRYMMWRVLGNILCDLDDLDS